VTLLARHGVVEHVFYPVARPRASGTVGSAAASEDTCAGVVVGRFAPIAACGLLSVLQADPRLDVSECDVEDAAVEGIRCAADVAVVDQPGDLALLVDRLRAVGSRTGVVVFARDPTPTYGMLALAHQVSCVASNVPSDELIASVHSASRGDKTFISVSGAGIERVCGAAVEQLTGREREVTVYLAEDASYREIARALRIGVRTVETHARSVRQKLRARDRRDLVGMPIPTHWRVPARH
jgi:DNA-binding NarL/FixJ family response regulator